MSWIAITQEASPDIIYGHIGVQEEVYKGKTIPMLCGETLSTYAISDIYPFQFIEELSDTQLCSGCCSKAEKNFWIKKLEIDEDMVN